jgi:hypothetical protein
MIERTDPHTQQHQKALDMQRSLPTNFFQSGFRRCLSTDHHTSMTVVDSTTTATSASSHDHRHALHEGGRCHATAPGETFSSSVSLWQSVGLQRAALRTDRSSRLSARRSFSVRVISRSVQIHITQHPQLASSPWRLPPVCHFQTPSGKNRPDELISDGSCAYRSQR